MTRTFSDRPVPDELLERLVTLAARAPSAGKTQGWHLVVLEGAHTSRFWDVTLPPHKRPGFRWQGLLRAPVVAIALADASAYLTRYSEDDKAATGLGSSIESWPAPYWTIDASMSVMTMLLAAQDSGLGALFFGVFHAEKELRDELGIPDHLQLLGAVALGWPDVQEAGADRGRSAARPRRSAEEIIHRNGW